MKMKNIFSTLALLATLMAGNASAETVHASFYGTKLADGSYRFHGRQMASGPKFNMYDPTLAAHKKLPFCTQLRLRNPSNGRELTVVVVDRGPYVKGRELDLSRAGAKQLGFLQSGVKRLEVLDVIKPKHKHRYGETCAKYVSKI